jgi:hypothetical protein
VQLVLTATVIYQMMALDLPKWAIKAIDKIRRGFLWRGRKEANGGHCMVAWGKVTRPKELGGLGISDLQCLNRALRVKWIWLQKTDSSKPWTDLLFQSNRFLDSLCSLAMASIVGDGQSTLFWHDRWLLGQRIADLAPHVFSLVPKRLVKRRTVADALCSSSWIGDLRGVVTWEVIADFILLANVVANIDLQPGVLDKHYWRFSSNGIYSAKSAYEIMFCGSTSLAGFEIVWSTWAPPKCQFFLWLVLHNKCWTADRLAKRGLPHPSSCPLCDQEGESIHHLLVSCVLARQFWYLLQRVGLFALSPEMEDINFEAWWSRSAEVIHKDLRDGFNSLVILGAWTIWRHRNDCVFNGAQPSIARLLTSASDEFNMWCFAGAKGLTRLSDLAFVFNPG